MQPRLREDITSESIKFHETWNDCPECGIAWKDAVATPGIIHRTRLCGKCAGKSVVNNQKSSEI